MSPNQKQVLDFVRRSIETRGIAPTYREIARALGGNSQGGAHDLVAALIRQGELVRTAARVRNIRLPTVDLSRVPLDQLLAEIERRKVHG